MNNQVCGEFQHENDVSLLLGASGFVGRSILDVINQEVSQVNSIYCVSSRSREIGKDFKDEWRVWNVLEPSPFQFSCNLIIHAATPASAELNTSNPEKMYQMNVRAMTNVVEFASRHKHPPIVLFTSSGAVYGDAPLSLERFPENWPVTISSNEQSSAYARGKKEAERILQEATMAGKCTGLIARMFAFSGVHLPIDRHFAIGNFVRDVVNSRTITIRSDGSSIRSYMDGKDMATWLLRIIEVGSPGEIYHVGSERSISIRDLASLVAGRYQLLTDHEASIEILGKASPLDGVSRYVPSTEWTREKLNLQETVSLELSIDQMIINAMTAS